MLVRTLSLGHQQAGFYRAPARAAYWDGRNAVGEPVASGVYFYTLTARDFTADTARCYPNNRQKVTDVGFTGFGFL